MAAIINTNIGSLNAQRNLTMSQTALATAMQRLSSGLRINSAKDDAAGLAISERFTTQIRGLNQAVRNANDGISLSQTAEGALGTISDNLQRIRELAVQSANATNNASDRAALDLEVQQRLAEIDRVASQTSFNGQKILDGSFGNAAFQVGANVGQTISLSLETSVRTNAIGAVTTTTSTGLAALNLEATPTTSTASGIVSGGVVSGTTTDPTVYTLTIDGNTLYTNTIATGATGTLVTAADLDSAWSTFSAANPGYSLTGTFAAGTAVISKADGTDMVIAQSTTGGTGGTVTAVTHGAGFIATHNNGVEATPLVLADGDFSIQIGSESAVSIIGTFNTATELIDHINTNVPGVIASVAGGELTLISDQDITVVDNATIGLASATLADDAAGNLTSIDVTTVAKANETLMRMDAALTAINDLRSTFGAIQNRFESTIANLATTAENLTASRSRILDADFAMETANLSRAQILQQAGTAMVAQANQMPQGILALLR